MNKTSSALALLLLVLVACSVSQDATPTDMPTTQGQAVLPLEPSVTPSSTPLPTERPVSLEMDPTAGTAELPDANLPSRTAPETGALGETFWYGADALALVILDDGNQADLRALTADGTTRLIFPEVGRTIRVSPDGRWLAFIHPTQQMLALHDAQTGEGREIVSELSGEPFAFAFDRTGRCLAYLDLGQYDEGGLPWALAVLDLAGDAAARYYGWMSDPTTRPLPGSPVAWSGVAAAGDELIIDTFMPATAGGWVGVWGVMLPADAPSASLDALALRELVPGAPVYKSKLYFAPDGQSVAFVGRDPEYYPDNFPPNFTTWPSTGWNWLRWRMARARYCSRSTTAARWSASWRGRRWGIACSLPGVAMKGRILSP